MDPGTLWIAAAASVQALVATLLWREAAATSKAAKATAAAAEAQAILASKTFDGSQARAASENAKIIIQRLQEAGRNREAQEIRDCLIDTLDAAVQNNLEAALQRQGRLTTLTARALRTFM